MMELTLNGENTEYLEVKDYMPTRFGDEEYRVSIEWKGGIIDKLIIQSNYGKCIYSGDDEGLLTLETKLSYRSY